MQKIQKIGSRPAYYDGQLLQADDFVAEQQYHRHARRLHNLALHGWGVVSGLEVRATGDHQITVQPGFAVDAHGREIELAQACKLDLDNPARTRLRVTLFYRHETEPSRAHRNRIDSYAVITASDSPDDKDALLLATLELDASGKIDMRSIDHSAVRRARPKLGPGSVDVDSLADSLRRGWMAVPFRGVPLERGPDGAKQLPPPFRLGTTEARSHSKWDGAVNTKGAGGTMTIAVPLGAHRLLHFRIAGVENEDRIEFHLVRGGFDKVNRTHAREILKEETIKGAPYNNIYAIEDGKLDPQYSTLSIWLHAHGKVSISLLAFEFSY